MNKYKIEIVQSTNCEEYYELKKLIKEFAINVFMAQNINLKNQTKSEKVIAVKNFENYLSKDELDKLNVDISNRIDLTKKLINEDVKDKITRFYIVKSDQEVIGFQTAQIRINQDRVEGWRNYAYIKPEFVGKIENVKDIYGIMKMGNISNIIYENITQWFKENDVTIERTATGKNMYKNILTYIVVKGFIPEKTDNERVYLMKEYNKIRSKEELKKIYKDYIKRGGNFMSRKIVAIGGGENGRLKSDGKRTTYPYELEKMDKEIIKLTGKEHPNFLLIAHSQPLERQEAYFQTMVDIYKKLYNCPCKDLKSNELNDKERVKELIDWADIIFEGGGDTLNMIKLWRKTGFDKILRNAWNNGKVMCGVSAGANCWFSLCNSDSLKIQNGNDQQFIDVECLGFIDAYLVPHCDENGRTESAKRLLKNNKKIGLLLSNCTALEIIDDKYRLITSDASYHNIDAYGLKSYWNDNKYFEEKIDDSSNFKELNNLLKKN